MWILGTDKHNCMWILGTARTLESHEQRHDSLHRKSMIKRSEIMKHVHQIKIASRYTPRRPASCRPIARPQRPEKPRQTVAEGREHEEMRYKNE